MRTVLARALPWLLVLPALILATPLSPLDDDPFPHLAGAGLAVVTLAPLALWILVRGAPGRGVWPFVLALVLALVSAASGGTDTLEERRALLVLCTLPAAYVGGTALDARGRAVHLALVVALSCAWTSVALVRGFIGEGFAGVLGDSGSLAQAALPGAAIACAWIAWGSGAKQGFAVLALLFFLVHVAAAPVLAGAHSLLAALLLAAWRGAPTRRGVVLALALCALVAPFTGMALREGVSGVVAEVEGAPSAPAHSLGGLGVRGMVWRAALGMVADHPLLGAGPGQFQAAFPPYRNPREIELSRHGVCAELDTEVEHAHNDWLQGFCELGLVGGGLLALGLALAGRNALRTLAEPERAPAAVAALAMLVNSFVHAPLSSNAAASVLALGLFGSVAAPSERRGRLAALPLFLAFPFAPALITHGAALTEYIRSARRIDELARSRGDYRTTAGLLASEAARARAVVDIALGAAPASAPARELAARNLPEGMDPFAAWERLLEVRPHAVEAWERTADLCATRGEFEEARRRYGNALALSPTHPRLLRDLARLECTQGELERGLATIADLRSNGCLDPAWLAELGNELVLVHGRPDAGARLMFSATAALPSPEELHACSRGQGITELASDALECLAQLGWGRSNAEAGRFELAVRNYRQALDRSRAHRPDGAPLYAYELAAAEFRAGHPGEAIARTHKRRPDEATWSALPPWARAALEELLARDDG